MKKTLLSLLLALSITAGCLSVPAYAETTATDGTEDPAMTETLPDLAQDAQAPQTDYAFGSVVPPIFTLEVVDPDSVSNLYFHNSFSL